MGYNNNNAGMHFQRYSHRAAYEDLRYYDKLAEEKMAAERAAKAAEEELEKKKEKRKKRNEFYKRQAKNRSQKKVEAPKKEVKQETIKKEERYLIPRHHFYNTEIVSRNAIRIAFEKKIDIVGLLYELEYYMNEDTNIQCNLRRTLLSDVIGSPKGTEVLIFISMLADKLGCDMSDLFKESDDENLDFAYQVIKRIPKFGWLESELTQEEYDSGNYFEIESLDSLKYFGIVADKKYENHKAYWTNDVRNFFLQKDTLPDGTELYSLGYGDMLYNADSAKCYIQHGATIWTEFKGELVDYAREVFDKMIIIKES